MVAGCAERAGAARPGLELAGADRGLSIKTFEFEARAGEELQVVLEQRGLDFQLAVSGQAVSVLGTYESATGRYGAERVRIKAEHDGKLHLTVSSPRFPEVEGTFKLTVRPVESRDKAESAYSAASRLDQSMQPSRRIELFMDAMHAFADAGRLEESGQAALAALNILNETASDSRLAVEVGERAVDGLRHSDNRLLLASAMTALAVAYGESKQPERMAAQFEAARKLFEAEGSRIGIAESRLFEAVLTYEAGRSEELMAVFQGIAKECEALGERVCESLALSDASVLLRNSGNYGAAFSYLYRALELVDAIADSDTYAQVSDNLAFSLRLIGDFDGAIVHHRTALNAYARYGECSGVSRMYYGLGYSLLGIGDSDQAMRYYKLALDRTCVANPEFAAPRRVERKQPGALELCAKAAEAQALDEDVRAIAAWTAWDLGNFSRSSGDLQGALACHETGSRLATTASYRLGASLETVLDLIELARIEDARKQYAGIQAELQSAHAWYRAQAIEVEARLKSAAGQSKNAIDTLGLAAHAYSEVGNLEGAYSALSYRAQLASRARHPRADYYFAKADLALERVRMLSLDPAFSASLFASGRAVYEHWVEDRLASRLDGIESWDTLAISERSRSRLLSQVAKGFAVGADARNARLRSVSVSTIELLERVEAGGIQADSSASKDASARLHRALGLEASNFDLEHRQQSIQRLRSFQRRLDTRTSVVEFLLGETRSHAWVLSRDKLSRVDLPAASKIRAAAYQVQRVISDGGAAGEVDDSLSILYDLVMGPLHEHVRGDRLVIVPDDVLHEISFAALRDRARQQYLIERMTISYLPSMEFEASRPSDSDGSLEDHPLALLVGDPAYEQDDAQRRCELGAIETSDVASSPGLRRIPASGREVEVIRSIFGAQSTPVVSLTGCAATRARVLDGQLRRYRYIHFATHATADRVVPQRSAIYLSRFDEAGALVPGQLSAADFLEHPLESRLVVLSGCSTAGGRQFSGEGSLGFSFSLMAAGTRQVISTLWPVADAASVSAMNRLYAGLLSDRLPVAEALRGAQLEMLAGARWKHPKHWAAYSLLGS
jgi:CHAT domain-containing protein/tetratricopeptide (TPR) repeat protein